MTDEHATPTAGEPSAGEGLDLSRRDYVKGLGAAGLASGLGLSADSAAAAIAESDAVTVGSGSYATAQPSGVNDPPGSDLLFATDDVGAPYPTNGWWTRELIGAASADSLEPYGYGFGLINAVPSMAVTKEAGDGFRTFYATEWGSDPASSGNLSVDYNGAPGLDVGHSAGSDMESRLAGYGDWHARIQYGTGSATLTATFTKGNAFTFCEYAGGEAEFALIDPDDNPLGPDSGQASVFYDGGNVLGLTVSAAGQTKHYGIFAPANVDFDGVDDAGALSNATIATAGLQSNGGYVSIAPLPDATASTIEFFADYAYNFVTDTTIDWAYEQTDADGNPVSQVRTTFTFSIDQKAESPSATAGTMSWLFPHQYKYTDATLTSHTLFSAKGTLKAWTGTSFETTKTYRGILPELPGDQLDASASSSLQSYVDDLIADTENNGAYSEWQPPAATYWTGKTLFRNTVAAPVARQHASSGSNAAIFVDAVQARLEHWFDATATSFSFDGTTYDTTTDAGGARELFYYDPTLGTMLGYPSGEFFLSRQLNDHHFHYGYYVYAASEVARQNPTWADEYGDMVDLLVRDYANWERPTNGGDPSTTPTAIDGQTPANAPRDAFPFLRNFDAYAGHSWAGGLGSWNGNNQEASSEAVNAYAAMIRWGEVTGNTELRDAGIFLYTQEVHAVWEYWFDVADDSQPDDWGTNVSDAAYAPTSGNFEYATKVRGIGFDRSLWWSPQDPIEHYGINWIPTGGHSFYLGRNRAYANANWQALLDARSAYDGISNPDGDFLGGWKAAAWTYRALSNPGDAVAIADGAMGASDGPVLKDGGNSGPVGYQFAHALDAMGTPDDVTADTPFYQVFADGTERTYVAHNAGDASITVSFSDGYSMSVPAGETVAQSSAANYSPDGTPPSQPSNLSVDATTYNSIDLSWDPVSDNSGGSGLFYYAVYLDDGSGFEKVAEAAEPQTTLTGLSAGTQYGVEVSAVDLAGNESSRAATSASTKSADTAVPNAPTGVFAIEWDADSVELGWTAVDDPDFGIDHYNVYVDGTKQTEAASPPHTLTGLSAGEIEVTVTAVNGDPAGNESDPSDPITVTLAAPSESNEPFFGTAQPLPGRLQVEYFDAGGSNVAYRDTTPGQEVSAQLRPDTGVAIGSDAPNGYNIAYTAQYEWLEYTVTVDSAGTYDVYGSYANNTGAPSGPIRLEVDDTVVGGPYDIPNNGSWTSFETGQLGTVTFDSPGEHVVRLYCVGGGFNLDWLEIRQQGSSGDATAPTAPSNLTATTDESSVTLEWDAASDAESSVFLYSVTQDGSPVATVADTSATIDGLSGGTEYEFAVAARDAFGNEGPTATLTATTDLPDNDTTPPTAPPNLRALSRTKRSIDVAWDPASDNVGVDHYVVAVDGAIVAEPAQPWATLDDLTPDTTYEVAVSAVDAAGNEGPATTRTVTSANARGQAPYTEPIAVPGTVKAERFDYGGQGVAYHDTTPGNQVNINQGAGIEFRNRTDVDIGALDGDYNVGYIAPGEWMEYTIEVPATGLYDVGYHVAAGAGGGGSFHLEIDGVDVTGAVSVSQTGGWTAYTTQGPIADLPLTKGTHVLRFELDSGAFNLDQLEIAPADGPELDRSGWTASASQTSQYDTPPVHAIDGDASTEWASGAPIIADASITFTVDMGTTETISQVSVDHLESASFPATFDVQTSTNGTDWTTVTTVSGAQSTVATFAPTEARFVRLVDRDETRADWWKITDLRAFEAASDLRGDDVAPGKPSGLTVDSQTGYQATLSWTAPGDADVNHYAVSVDGALVRRVGTTSAVVSALTPGESYEVAVVAVDDAGNASAASSTTVTTDVAVEFAQTATEASPSTLEIAFTPEERVEAATLEATVGGTTTTVSMLNDAGGGAGTEWYAVLGGLSGGDSIDYRIVYERAGAARETQWFTHDFTGSGGEGAAGLTVTAAGPASVSLSWTASSAAVTGYAVREGSTRIATAGSDQTSIDVTGLRPDTRYTFCVVGTTSDGQTPPSNTVTVETPSVSTAQATALADAWLDGDAPDGIALPAGTVDYGTVRDAAANATEGEQ